MKQKVILNIAISLDGYAASLNDGTDWLEPFGNLSEYGFDEFIANTGAIIMGKRSYDIGIENDWFKDAPYGPSPIFVICSEKPSSSPSLNMGDFRFINEGIEAAYEVAKSTAGNKNIYLFGGPNIVQQSLKMGLIDEIQLSIAPVILGKGIPLFANLNEHKINLERIEVKSYSGGLTSIHYKVADE
jgi:dihydrofolate reductase